MTKSNYCSVRKKTGEVKNFNLKYLNLFIFVFIAVFGGFYLFNINELTVQGFALQELRMQVDTLAGEKMDIEEKINSTQSYYSLSSRLNGLNMVEASNIEYLKDSGQAIAKK